MKNLNKEFKVKCLTLNSRWPKWNRGLLAKAGILLLVSLAACSTVPPKASSNSLLTVQSNSEKRSDVSGSGSISWVSDDKNVAAPGILLVSWPDKLHLEIQDPVGGMLALLVMNGDHFWWYSSDQKEITTGKLESMKAVVGLPFEAQDLVRAFLGRPGVEKWKAGQIVEHSSTLQVGSVSEFLEWSDRLNEPTVWKRMFPNGQRIEVLFEDYLDRFGASYPSKVRIASLLKDRRQLTISWVWKDWQPRVPGEKKLFQIPQEQHFGRKIKALP